MEALEEALEDHGEALEAALGIEEEAVEEQEPALEESDHSAVMANEQQHIETWLATKATEQNMFI